MPSLTLIVLELDLLIFNPMQILFINIIKHVCQGIRSKETTDGFAWTCLACETMMDDLPGPVLQLTFKWSTEVKHWRNWIWLTIKKCTYLALCEDVSHSSHSWVLRFTIYGSSVDGLSKWAWHFSEDGSKVACNSIMHYCQQYLVAYWLIMYIIIKITTIFYRRSINCCYNIMDYKWVTNRVAWYFLR